MADRPLTKRDLEEILDTKLDQKLQKFGERLELRLEQRLEQKFDQKLDQKFGAFRKEMLQRLDEQAEATADLADMVSARFDQVDERLGRLEKRADSTERILQASIRRID